MLTMQNNEDYMIDPIENSIKIIGENDGSFDSDDYILFYTQPRIISTCLRGKKIDFIENKALS